MRITKANEHRKLAWMDTRQDRVILTVSIVLLSFVLLVMVIPLMYVLAVSFTSPVEYMAKGFVLFPTTFSLESYKYLLSSQDFPRAMGISALITVIGTPLSMLVSTSLAYALSVKRFIGRKIINIMIVFTMVFNPGIIPRYLLVRSMGLIDNIWSLILPVICTGYNVILLRSYFESIPVSLQEAATIDGCNELQIWYKIMLPLSLASIATVSLFYAVAYWNTYFSALIYIMDNRKQTLQILLRNMLSSANTTASTYDDLRPPAGTIKMAAVVVSTIPVLVVYPFAQRFFEKGVMLGAVKG